ncbi:nucleotidyltransferase family protein [Chachezhania sediminis]|uniref:nucleotidyltransferase family protein n=1 Tax=Chachezhania sediminis TaxID=2599291 RepID=UPI00131C2A26|nr:nucleotidyltransferase family protein [Chachezhania sediminis]
MTDGALATVILAAGSSSRMEGRDKLMERVENQPLLHLVVSRAVAAGPGPVVVALPVPSAPFGPARWACVEDLEVRPVSVPDAAEGMNASLRAGIAALPKGIGAAMILLADLPELTEDDLRTVRAAVASNPGHQVWRGVDESGKPGHPVVFSADLFPDLLALEGDGGAQGVVRAHAGEVCTVALPGRHASRDLDTPEDWDAWRQDRG